MSTSSLERYSLIPCIPPKPPLRISPGRFGGEERIPARDVVIFTRLPISELIRWASFRASPVPPSIRIWGGSTVQNNDIKALLPWIDWAYNTVKQNA